MFATEDLRVFAAVAQEGSFSRAAMRLHLAQPSISERIARLERQAGTALFTRTNRGADLTGAGRRLLPYALRCLELCAQAVRAVRANDADARFRVLMHSSFAPVIMPFLVDVLAGHSIELSNNDAHSEEVVRAVADGTADVGFTIAVPHPHNVRLEPFYEDPVVCVAAPEHPLVGASELSVRDLMSHNVAVNVWGDGAASFIEQLEAAPIAASRLRPVSPAETAVALARLRGYIAVCTFSTVIRDLTDGRLVELPVIDLPRWVVETFLVWREADQLEGPIEAILKSVKDVEGSPSAWLGGPGPAIKP